ncbi:hypothetical protein DFH09DRAFT_1308403 [Mycena vulgaris]|nr:hypothetical protein DFH09DRAFT_1308403 [Mycena vulgaris]
MKGGGLLKGRLPRSFAHRDPSSPPSWPGHFEAHRIPAYAHSRRPRSYSSSAHLAHAESSLAAFDLRACGYFEAHCTPAVVRAVLPHRLSLAPADASKHITSQWTRDARPLCLPMRTAFPSSRSGKEARARFGLWCSRARRQTERQILRATGRAHARDEASRRPSASRTRNPCLCTLTLTPRMRGALPAAPRPPSSYVAGYPSVCYNAFEELLETPGGE